MQHPASAPVGVRQSVEPEPHRHRDVTPGQRGGLSHNWLTNPLRDLIEQAVRCSTPAGSNVPDPERLVDQPIFRLTPFVETMGPTRSGRRKEFWWEREWRKIGSFDFTPQSVIAAVIPACDHDRLRSGLAAMPGYKDIRLVDATWPSGTIVEMMSDVAPGPFPG
ncbi:hypothetical protein [Dactylosporangium sp. NPDC051541]|uniref:hypothetical protein n=1 Tax=Dactylosporangium sp. NPDC051541 TaxID=3363977 RepID=UPI0037BC38FC